MMEKTRSKSKSYFTTVNVMAALFSVLLLVGIFCSHAGAASAAPDIKVNGMDTRAALIRDAVLCESADYTFTSSRGFFEAISGLKAHVAAREAAALEY